MATSSRILHNFLTDASAVAVTGSTAVSGNPVTNVQDARVNKVFRTSVKGDAFVKFNMGAPTAMTMLAFLKHNLTSAATVRLWGHTSNLGDTAADWSGVATLVATFTHDNAAGGASAASFITAGLVTSGAVAAELPPRWLNGVAYFGSTSKQWWFLSIQDSGNSDAYIELGRVVGGLYKEPTRTFRPELEYELEDPSEELQLEGVAMTMTRQQAVRGIYNLDYTLVSAADRTIHQEMMLNVGRRQPFIVNPQPDVDINELIYGKVRDSMRLRRIQDSAGHTTNISWTVEEQT